MQLWKQAENGDWENTVDAVSVAVDFSAPGDLGLVQLAYGQDDEISILLIPLHQTPVIPPVLTRTLMDIRIIKVFFDGKSVMSAIKGMGVEIQDGFDVQYLTYHRFERIPEPLPFPPDSTPTLKDHFYIFTGAEIEVEGAMWSGNEMNELVVRHGCWNAFAVLECWRNLCSRIVALEGGGEVGKEKLVEALRGIMRWDRWA